MGASGNLAIIDLKKYSFENIKQKLLDKLENYCQDNWDSHVEYEFWFKVNELSSLESFIRLFGSKIVDYCPEENGIWINNKFIKDWSGNSMPQILDDYLIIYGTDQQMYYQNIPYDFLYSMFESDTEIWT